MTQQLTFDFRHIDNLDHFYRQFSAVLPQPEQFGANLDALWDAITGQIALPLHVTLRHLSQHPDAQQFNALIELLQDAEQETEGAFRLFIIP